MSPHLRSAGPVSWMARHSVAPNLLMLVLILGGIFMSTKIKQEYLPATDRDTVTVAIALPGATPEEVEQSIILAVEEELRSIQGIDKLVATANEGAASIVAELSTGRDRRLVYNDIQQAVDRVTTFPEDAEEPQVTLDARRREVVELHLYGDVDARSLRMAAEHVRNSLLQQTEISQVDLEGSRDLEIDVEISRAALRAHGLTLSGVAATIREAALDRSGGTLETRGGDVLLRLADRRGAAKEFALIPLIADRRGTVLRLGDVAEVRPGFEDGNMVSTFDEKPSIRLNVFRTFDEKPSIRLNVFRVGDETPITVSDAVKRALPGAMATLPEAIQVVTLRDRSNYFRDRMNLLLKNGFIGLILVLCVLSLFLEYKLAFWVAVGIPTAFLGTLLFLPIFGASINLVSMFAFILALGIVVDDAIVAGENIYEYLERGMSRIDAAIQGARDIAVPLSFSILTNIVAFIPLALVPGVFGKFWVVIPIVVSIAFLLSWIEALFVLPAHLANVRRRDQDKPANLLIRCAMRQRR
jgi:multidrug efflux pump subunit AcrB